MSKNIHLIMPMAGRGSRFAHVGFDYPKPLISIYDKPFFYWSTKSIESFVKLESLDFVVLREHIDSFDIDGVIRKYFPDARVHILEEVTEGAVITCLKGVEYIEDDLPVVFNDCDHLFKSKDFNRFCMDDFSFSKNEADGVLLTFYSNEPKYSFVKKDDKGNAIKTAEKEVISNEAICGCYYFRDVNTFKNASKEYLDSCSYSEYFMSGVYNTLIENGKAVKSISTDFHVPYGVPEEYEAAKKDNHYKELL